MINIYFDKRSILSFKNMNYKSRYIGQDVQFTESLYEKLPH